MECLYKVVCEDYRVDFYEDRNDIDMYRQYSRRKKHNRWTHSGESINTKEVFLENYANKLANIYLERQMIVVEKDETKVSLKYYHYFRLRRVGTHYFTVKKNIHYITYNKKTNIVYIGKKYGKASSIRSNPFGTNEISDFTLFLYNIIKNKMKCNGVLNQNDEYWKMSNIFTNNCFDYEHDQMKGLTELFLENYVKVHNITVPDNYKVFFRGGNLTLRDIKRAKNNLLLAIEKKHKLRGKKFHRVLHKLETFNPYIIKDLITFFGMDKIKQLPDEDLSKILQISWQAGFDGDNMVKFANDFTPQEKKRMLDIFLDCVRYNGSFRTYSDHVKFLITLHYEYNDKHLWESKNRKEFTQEHVMLSNLISKYENGIYDRIYSQDFMNSFDTQFIHNGGVYYPVVLCMDVQYKEESETQHNCVKTYTKNVKSCIISLREGSPDSDVRATIQYSLINEKHKVSGTRLQTLGRFNKVLDDNWIEPVKMLDEHMSQALRKFKIDDYKITKSTYGGSKIYDVTPEFTVMFDDDKKNNFHIDW